MEVGPTIETQKGSQPHSRDDGYLKREGDTLSIHTAIVVHDQQPYAGVTVIGGEPIDEPSLHQGVRQPPQSVDQSCS